MNYFFDRQPLQSVDDAISEYDKGEFESQTRSTVPLISMLKHDMALFKSLLEDLKMPIECNLHLEYKVASPKGKGKESHTDLMAIKGDDTIAIEVKWTEPDYIKVEKWLNQGTSQKNREDVLNGWLSLLQSHSAKKLDLKDFKVAVYQMVHRAASACAAGKRPRLAYLLFGPSPDSKATSATTLQNELSRLLNLLGNPKDFPFYLVEATLSPTSVFQAISNLPKGAITADTAVIPALLGKYPMFKVAGYTVTKI